MTEGLNLWDMSIAQGCGFGGCLGLEGAEQWSGPASLGSRRCLFPATATSGVQEQGEMEGCCTLVQLQ